MSSLRNRALALASGTIFLTAFTTGAMALDASTVGTDMKAALLSQGVTFDYASAELDGDNVVLKGAKAGLPDAKEAGDWVIGDLTLEGVAERDGGGHTIEQINLPEVTKSHEGTTFEISDVVLANVSLPATAKSGDFFKDAFYYENFSIGKIAGDAGTKGKFSVDNIEATSTPLVADQPLTSEGSIGAFDVTLPPAGSDKTLQAIHALGYANFSGNATFKSNWNPVDGASTLSESKVTINDAASLDITGDFGGLTVEVLKAIQEISANAQQPDQSPETMQLAMMGLMQQMTFGNLAIRLEDDSLTNKVIDYVAQQQGTNRDGLIGQAQFILPAALGYFQNPAFTQAASAEVVKFLQDPKSLTIAARPDQPLPVVQLMTLGQTPQAIPTTLNLSVTAND